MREVPCDPQDAAGDTFPFGDTVSFSLEGSEQALYDAYHAARSKDEFALSIGLGPSEAIAASAHFRGQSSLKCERKPYSVNLQGSGLRRLWPTGADDEFYLVSLCLDRRYFRQIVSNKLMAREGLFPIDQRLVRLVLNGIDQGAYLLMEKPVDTLRRDRTAVAAVVRRRLDADNKAPEVQWPGAVQDASQVLSVYQQLSGLIDSEPPASLEASISERLDLDGYLRWLAFNTLFQSGDYVDEAYFYASPELDTPGQLYWRHHGWDSDDLFQECHHQGRFAHEDPHGLLYCAEGDLDRALLVSPSLYRRFVDVLEDLMMQRFTDEVVGAALDQTREELFEIFSEESTCAAMVEVRATHPEVVDCETLQEVIALDMANFLAEVQARRQSLAERIRTYRGP